MIRHMKFPYHRRRIAAAAALLCCTVSGIARAQDMTLDLARRIGDGVIAYAHANRLRPMAVVVLDQDGGIRVALREDGVGPGALKVVEGKAAAAFDFRLPTRVLADIFAKDAAQTAALTGALGGRFVVIPGGRPIFDKDNRMIGAVAAGGDKSDQDDAAVMAALEALGLHGASVAPKAP